MVSRFSVYDGIANGHREVSTISESVANARRALRAVMPNQITSGMIVSEDTDVTNPLDVTMSAGVLWKDILNEVTPSEIKSRTAPMVKHFHATSVWSSATSTEIDTTNYDNGTDLAVIPASKWVKAVFIYMGGVEIGWIYPNTYYNTEAQALLAPLPSSPTGLSVAPTLTAIVYKQGDASFVNTTWQDARPGKTELSLNGVTDHDSLTNLLWADSGHTGDVSTLAGFDGSGIASYYTEANYPLLDGTRTFTDLTIDNININGNTITTTGNLNYAPTGNVSYLNGRKAYYYSDGNDKTIWAWHNDTDGEIGTSSGDLKLQPVGNVNFQSNDITNVATANITDIVSSNSTLDWAFDNGKVIDGASSTSTMMKVGGSSAYVGFVGGNVGLGFDTSNIITSETYSLFMLGNESTNTEPLLIVTGSDTTSIRSPILRVTGWGAGGLLETIDLSFQTTYGGDSTITTSAGDLVLNPVGDVDIYHATTTSVLYISSGGGAVGGRIIMEDTDGAGCTSIDALNGVLTVATTTCP